MPTTTLHPATAAGNLTHPSSKKNRPWLGGGVLGVGRNWAAPRSVVPSCAAAGKLARNDPRPAGLLRHCQPGSNEATTSSGTASRVVSGTPRRSAAS